MRARPHLWLAMATGGGRLVADGSRRVAGGGWLAAGGWRRMAGGGWLTAGVWRPCNLRRRVAATLCVVRQPWVFFHARTAVLGVDQKSLSKTSSYPCVVGQPWVFFSLEDGRLGRGPKESLQNLN